MNIDLFAWRCLMWAHIAQLTALCNEVPWQHASTLGHHAGWLVQYGRMCLDPDADVALSSIVDGPEGKMVLEHVAERIIEKVREKACLITPENHHQLDRSAGNSFCVGGVQQVALTQLWREQWATIAKARRTKHGGA